MKHTTSTVGAILLAGTIAGCSSSPSVSESKVIYGTDERKEIYDPANAPAMVSAAASTAALIHHTDLTAGPSAGTELLPKTTFKDLEGVCDSEPFAQEPSAAFCSGFLVGPDIFVTAGHCVVDQNDCDSISMVFDYAYNTPASDPTLVHPDNVYNCKELINRKQEETGADYAVVRLDRPVVGRTPLPFRSDGKVDDHASLTMIGYPVGIPAKIDAEKIIRDNATNGYFVSDTDSYGGNSGSAVFNSATGQVEGVLVRGEQDFDFDSAKNCSVSKHCDITGCRGEDITRATEFAQFVPH
jgi:V8-like Glu-specific endopeptidase